MDMLAGYGSGSDDDEDEQEAHVTAEAAKAQPAVQQQTTAPVQQQQQAQAGPSLKLPSPDELLGNPKPLTASSNPTAKRPFNTVTGHSLPKSASQPKATKDHAAARPGAAAKPGSSTLMPPQLQGRSNVVTEDLDKIFSKKSSPAGRKAA